MKKSPLISLMALSAVAWPVAGETLPPIHSRTLDEATRNKILLINEGGEPCSLDPQMGHGGVSEYHIIMGLIEGLVGCHPTDQPKEVPGVADRWEHNDDYSVWTFHIGEDRKWSNFASVIPLFLSEKHIHISDNISGESN
jgi:ABC-type oligopeptide transport system substrate-binding subunit